MTPAQIRAARAALDWTQADLADRAGINVNSVAYHEAGKARATDKASPAVQKMQAAFAGQGVRIEGHSLVLPQ